MAESLFGIVREDTFWPNVKHMKTTEEAAGKLMDEVAEGEAENR